VDDNLQAARVKWGEYTGDKQAVFHISAGHHVPTTMHTKTALDLADQLKLRIKLGKYSPNLDDSLEHLSNRHVAVLERILARQLHQ
jgi:hypothetical protein